MKVLVTGATGFIGSQLTAELVRRGYQVRVLRRATSKTLMLDGIPGIEHVLGDILEPDTVARAVQGCELVFHVAALASYWRTQRAQVYRINVQGTQIVMDACLRAGVQRVVYTSSVAAIGIPRNGQAADETFPFDPFSATFAYADSKHRAEEVVRQAVAAGLDAVIVNPAAVIGPGDHNLITGSIIVEYARRPLPFVTPGGLCVADVQAVVEGHILAAQHGRAGERYILGGENLSHQEIARVVTEVVGRQPPRWTLPTGVLGPAAIAIDTFNRIAPTQPVVSGEQIRLSAFKAFYDSSKAVRELGYPLLPFRPAVEKAYAWYRQHGYLN
ncbi:MAG: SDR family oxidoreductase [Anaerolineae bacterium]